MGTPQARCEAAFKSSHGAKLTFNQEYLVIIYFSISRYLNGNDNWVTFPENMFQDNPNLNWL